MLPLLAKDLTERAARRRTYVLRAVFGLALVGWFWWFMHTYRADSDLWTPGRASDGLALMGTGKAIFAQLSELLCWALLWVQPALMASALTHEKERGTLELLLLTPMRPWKLLLEKFLAGLLPMATLLLFGLPLGAVAYSYGGVSPETLWSVSLVLFFTWLQTGAAALCCSAWCRTTPAAVLCSYLLLGGFYFATSPELRPTTRRTVSSEEQLDLELYRSDRSYVVGPGFDTNGSRPAWWPATTWPVSILRRTNHAPVSGDGGLGSFENRIWASARPKPTPAFSGPLTLFRYDASPSAVLRTVAGALLIPTILFLVLARIGLLRRAHARPRRWAPRFFAWLDGLFDRTNRLLGGVTLIPNRADTLSNQPILWRESTTGILGRTRYLVRISVSLTVFCGLVLVFDRNLANLLLHLIVLLGGVVLVVRGVEAIGGERQRQTLEVLLSTPVPRGEIIRHKAWPLVSLSLALLAPIVIIFLLRPAPVVDFRTLSWYVSGRPIKFSTSLLSLASLLVAFWELRWLGLAAGLWIRSRSKATLVALAIIALWVWLPPLIDQFIHPMLESKLTYWLHFLPPDGLLAVNDRGGLFLLTDAAGVDPAPLNVLLLAGAVLLFHSLIALFLRHRCLSRAEHHLCRL